VTPLPGALGGTKLVAWRLDQATYAAVRSDSHFALENNTPGAVKMPAKPIQLTPELDAAASTAVGMFSRDARASYGDGLVRIVLFGSRVRGEDRPDSDVDLAVVLKTITDRIEDRNRLADIAYEAIVETGVDVHAHAVSEDEWEQPERHRNPDLVHAIKRDGKVL